MDDIEKRYKYAWDWFQYHANQRIITFNFFLVVIGTLIYAYFSAPCSNVSFARFLIGIIGVIISFAFLVIEVRNTILVDDGRRALDNLEGNLENNGVAPYNIMGIRKADLQRIGYYDHDKLGCGKRFSYMLMLFCSHNFSFRLILSGAIFISALAATDAKYGFNIGALVGISVVSVLILFFSINNRIIKPLWRR
jgi:hypothetical protein